MNKQNKLIKLIQSQGCIFPTDEDSVIEFEKIYENDIKSIKPKEWDNPLNILKKGFVNKLEILQDINPSAENLAQAARDGKQLSSEIKKRMLEDRSKQNE
jgi:hypothetical protein